MPTRKRQPKQKAPPAPTADAPPRTVTAPETKASATFALFRDEIADTIGTVIKQGESVDTMLKKYGQSTTWVYIAVNRLSTACAQIPIDIAFRSRISEADPLARDDDPLYTLLRRPNPYESGDEFVEKIVQSLALSGDAFVEKVAPRGESRPRELYVLNPARVHVKPDPKRKVREYVFTGSFGTDVRFAPEQICHIKLPNPTDDFRGLAPISAARRAIDVDTFSLDWNTNFLQKGAWPGGSVETDQPLDDDQITRLRRMISRHLSRGKERAGEVMLLTHGLKYRQIAVSPKDLDWLSGRRMSRDEILAVFGVPFAVAGLFSTEQTTARSAGVEQQIKQFYRNTVTVYVNRILSAFNRDFVPAFNSDYVLTPDLRSVPALQDDVQTDLARAQTLRLLVLSRVPLNAAIAYVFPHAGWKKFAWGDVAWDSTATVPIDSPTANIGARIDTVPTPSGDAAPPPAAATTPADVDSDRARAIRLRALRTAQARLRRRSS